MYRKIKFFRSIRTNQMQKSVQELKQKRNDFKESKLFDGNKCKIQNSGQIDSSKTLNKLAFEFAARYF